MPLRAREAHENELEWQRRECAEVVSAVGATSPKRKLTPVRPAEMIVASFESTCREPCEYSRTPCSRQQQRWDEWSPRSFPCKWSTNAVVAWMSIKKRWWRVS